MFNGDTTEKSFKAYDFSQRDLIVAGALFLIAAVFYTMTMTPSVSAGDNGELTTAMFFLGIGHAPGYPLHSFMGKLFTFLPINNVGWRANFFSAFCGALTIFFTVLVYIKILLSTGVKKHYAWASAVMGGLAFMFSDTLWSQAIMCEVYTLSALFYPAMTLILLRWHDDVREHENDRYPYFGERYLIGFSFLFGVAMCNHQTVLGIAPFAAAYILYVLVRHTFLSRRLAPDQILIGVIFILGLALLLLIAYLTYYYYIMRLHSNLYIQSNLTTGMFWFILCNAIMLLVYLYFRFLAPDSVDPHNYLQKLFFVTVKMFMLFYVGFGINFYMFIRAHGYPPINWMGISETKETWLKFSKLFNAIWRKQFGEMGKLPFTISNYGTELGLLFKKILYHQFSLPLYLLAALGMVKLLLKNKVWFALIIWAMLTYNLALTSFLRFNFNERDIFFVQVFYIFSYFLISIAITAGIAFLLELIGKGFNRQDDPVPVTQQDNSEVVS